ncbi:MAG: MerR family DNA-binding protein [Gammaproteobacteria bacterium]|nr:MerR family DNA-binding protein [Gammaproteobacteria bacterium]
MLKNLTIGKVAAFSEISVETIRYYQKIGLIKEPDKPLSGYRLYNIENIKELKFIKKAQRLGFNLTEIAELFAIGSGKCSDIQTKARMKRDQISRQIADLQALEQTLDDLIDCCRHSSSEPHCPLIESLSEFKPD